MYSTLIEIFGERHYCMLPSVFQSMSNQIRTNIKMHIPVSIEKDYRIQTLIPFHAGQMNMNDFSAEVFMGDADCMKRWGELEDDDQVINVVRLVGAMTRNGGDCSYGSIQLRDKMMRAADMKQTIGHIIYANTPGGMTSTLLDFRKAIEYCRSKGQKVYMFCDGTVASCGAFVSAICDGVYFFNGDDQIGSFGMYSAFMSMKNGDKDPSTGETYRECYASRSTRKNEEYRAAANDDMSILQKEVDDHLEEIIANLKKDRPQVKEEQLDGAMFKMKDVVGSLVDGQLTMKELATKIYDDWAACQKNKKLSGGGRNGNQNSNSKNTNAMNKEYKEVAAFIGEEPYMSDKEGCLTLQEGQADALEGKLATINATSEQMLTENSDLKQQVETLTASEKSLKEERDLSAQKVVDLTEKLNAANALAEQYKASSEVATQTAAGLQEQVTTLTTAKEVAEATIATQQTTIEENAQVIADQASKITSLEKASGKVPDLGESPKTNGAQGGVLTMEQAPKWDPMLSAKENKKRYEAYNEKLRQRAINAQQ